MPQPQLYHLHTTLNYLCSHVETQIEHLSVFLQTIKELSPWAARHQVLLLL